MMKFFWEKCDECWMFFLVKTYIYLKFWEIPWDGSKKWREGASNVLVNHLAWFQAVQSRGKTSRQFKTVFLLRNFLVLVLECIHLYTNYGHFLITFPVGSLVFALECHGIILNSTSRCCPRLLGNPKLTKAACLTISSIGTSHFHPAWTFKFKWCFNNFQHNISTPTSRHLTDFHLRNLWPIWFGPSDQTAHQRRSRWSSVVSCCVTPIVWSIHDIHWICSGTVL